MTVNERIRALRKARGLTMDKLGALIGITKGSISLIEQGRNHPSDQTIRSICREFGVREEWLRDGVEPMEAEHSISEEIDGFLKDIKTNNNEFRTRLVALLARLNQEEWKLLESMAHKLAEREETAQESQTI